MKNTFHIISFFKKNLIEIPCTEKDDADYSAGDIIIYRDEEGSEDAGKINYIGPASDAEKLMKNACVLRKATSHDLQKIESHEERKAEAVMMCCDKVTELNLNMHVFDASFSFDGKRLAFLFTADERVDFRELVKILAGAFKKQIHLHQVGPRDRARMLATCGKCGKRVCCKSWMDKLLSITMEMVRVQGLEGKGGSKLSGVCGKLLCCLRFEVEEYNRMREGLPEIGSIVATKDNEAEVIGLDVLNRKVKIITREGQFMVIEDKEIKKIISTPTGGRKQPSESPESEPELI
ncbi:MAG: PSP1 domain-containing protein [Candidatus Peregrinibacteria bacterium GW2011_GWC2_39_14]|nr:MAG: PSP1 domain protein [Candidatus Peregrinibacteria bacterium GW2011_GWA2_38_36]KKR07101.1 MAG: PSP1 domain-containing protein [Candidatus Peregrinibacteria bacterium GW2011_GWC2_39_14]